MTLEELAVRVEGLQGACRETNGLIADEISEWRNIGGWMVEHKVTGERRGYSYREPPAYTSSLDAALMLVPEGWVIGSLDWWPMNNHAGITLLETDERGHNAMRHRRTKASAATPACALTAAALRSRSTTGGEHD